MHGLVFGKARVAARAVARFVIGFFNKGQNNGRDTWSNLSRERTAIFIRKSIGTSGTSSSSNRHRWFRVKGANVDSRREFQGYLLVCPAPYRHIEYWRLLFRRDPWMYARHRRHRGMVQSNFSGAPAPLTSAFATGTLASCASYMPL